MDIHVFLACLCYQLGVGEKNNRTTQAGENRGIRKAVYYKLLGPIESNHTREHRATRKTRRESNYRHVCVIEKIIALAI